jgi:hypothetical protein
MTLATIERYGANGIRTEKTPRELSLEEQAQAALSNSQYLARRKLSCDVKGGVLILRGRIPSFHLKQVAHSLLRRYLEKGIVLDDRSDVAYDTVD